MAATIRDVAKRAGVGVGTVSRVLNGSTAVSPATRQKVVDAMRELDYVPNAMARRLSLGKKMTIGVLAPFFTRRGVVERLRGIESILSQTSYDLNIFNIETAEQRQRYLNEVNWRERLDGLLIITITPDEAETDRLLKQSIPVVLIDAESDKFSQVIVDDVTGGYMATRHLIGIGHQQIAFISDVLDYPLGNNSSYDRFVGYQKALQEVELLTPDNYHLDFGFSRRDGLEMARQLLALPTPPTAIVAASDTHAMGVLKAAEEAQLNIPRDLSVIGYDDIEIAEHLNLTTIRQPLFQSGKLGAEMLLSQIESGATTAQKVQLPLALVVRATTKQPQAVH